MMKAAQLCQRLCKNQERKSITTSQMKMDKEYVGYYWEYALCLQIRVMTSEMFKSLGKPQNR